jgi:hypothetical protein
MAGFARRRLLSMSAAALTAAASLGLPHSRAADQVISGASASEVDPRSAGPLGFDIDTP